MHKAFLFQLQSDSLILGRIRHCNRRQALALGICLGKLQAAAAVPAVHSHMQSPLPQHPGADYHETSMLIRKNHALLP